MTYFLNQIQKRKFLKLGQNVLIHIGTFKYTVGVGPIEIKSFEDGLIFGKELVSECNKKIKFRILVDDIGIDPKKRKEIKENFRLPKAYLDKMVENKVSEKDIDILFESSIRNKASHILSRQKHILPGRDKLTKEVVCFDQACEYERCVPQSSHAKQKKSDRDTFSIIDPYSGIPLILKEGPNPKCNLILACSYFQGAKSYDSIISFCNALWEQRMYYGAMVARILFGIQKPIIDFFYYTSEEKAKIIIHNSEELKDLYERTKTKLVKKILASKISNHLKDEYISKIESISNADELEDMKEKFTNLL